MSAKLYNKKMKISTATEADIDEILNLQTQIYRVKDLAPNAKDSLKKQLQNKSCTILVTREENEIVATATIYYIDVAARGRPYALLEGLVVDEKHRSKGIGTQLFKKCIEKAKENNCYKMIFTSGYNREDAHNFYEKLGFKKWGYEFRIDLNS